MDNIEGVISEFRNVCGGDCEMCDDAGKEIEAIKLLIKDTRLLLDEIYEFDKPVSQEIIEAVELELQKLGSQ